MPQEGSGGLLPIGQRRGLPTPSPLQLCGESWLKR